MLAKVQALFLFCCCFLVAVGPLNLLQVVAWGNMLGDYSDEKTFVEAADMTFSGEFPCEMCRRIAEAKATGAEEKQDAPLPLEDRNSLRLDARFEKESSIVNLTWESILTFLPGEYFLSPALDRFRRVPTPPPQIPGC